ncbi:hypothetical protein D046_5615B, partial [Vibrio parahaemolyticus V-223/04]
RTL